MILEDQNDYRTAPSLPLLRITPNHTLSIALQIDGPVWFQTHFIGKQLLCCGMECRACVESTTRRMGFVTGTIQWKGSTRAILLEVTPTTWNRFKLACEASDITVSPGLVVEATRSKQRAPMVIEPVERKTETLSYLDDRGFIIDCVAKIHGIQSRLSDESISDWSKRTQLARHLLIEQQLDK